MSRVLIQVALRTQQPLTEVRRWDWRTLHTVIAELGDPP